MQIAWRYQNVKGVEVSDIKSVGNEHFQSNIAAKCSSATSFDLAKKMSKEQNRSKCAISHNVRDFASTNALLERIRTILEDYSLYNDTMKKNALRLSIQLFGSPSYSEFG